MDSEQHKPTSQQHASTPGATLAAAREAMGLSVEQVADQLKLAPRQVVAIEQGDFDALPNRAVTRGFIRAYAKAMRLDPAPLVAMVEVEGAVGHADATVRPTMVKASFQESRFPSLNERNSGKPLGAIVAGVGVLALLGLAAAWQMGILSPLTLATRGGVAAPAEPPVPVVVTQPGTQPADGPMQTQSVPLISVPPQPGSNTAPDAVAGVGVPGGAGGAPGTVPTAAPGMTTTTGGIAAPGTAPAPATGNAAGAPATGVAPVNRAAPVVGGVPAVGPAPAATTPASPGLIPVKPAAVAPAPAQGTAPVATAPAVPVAVAGAAPAVGAAGGKLVLTVREDSWVEIRRAGQANLTRGMVRAGSTQTFNVRADDVLIVGKPSAVNANLAGGKLELTQGPGKSYALVNIK